MVRDILVCYHFLNVLILVLLLMIVMIIETDIVPQGISRKIPGTNMQQFDYDSEILFTHGEGQIDVEHVRPIYTSYNDTFLPLLSPEQTKQYGGFREVGGLPGVFVYSANYDNRGKPPGIQVVVIAPYSYITSTEYVCHMRLSNTSWVRVTGHMSYFPEPHWNYTYRSGAVYCPLQNEDVRPKTVSLLAGEDDVMHNSLPVRYPERRKNDITRCYPAFHSAYNNVSILIWNIEISRVFGVDKFIFYNYDTSAAVSKVLLQYQREGLAEVRNWNLPVDHRTLHYWGQLASMHDCFYSHVGKSRFILFADIDELVIPRKVGSLVRLAEILLYDATFSSKFFGALIFRNVFFPVILPKDEEIFPGKAAAEAFDISPLLHTIHSQVHTAYDRSKLLVIPEAVEYLWIHAVEKFRKNWIPRVVDGDVARLHHYRYIPSLDMRPPWQHDRLLFRYSNVIVKAIRRRYSQLKKSKAI